jgi:CRP-like cAMP-binding protein
MLWPPSAPEIHVTKPDSPLALMVRKLSVHADLSSRDTAILLALPFSHRTLDAGSYLVRENESPEHCAVLVSGYAYRQKLTGDGTRQIVSIHLPGDPLDLQHLFLDIADHNVQILSRAEVAIVSRESLRCLVLENASIAQAILSLILVEASIFREWILNLGRRGARARLAHLLCEFAARLDAIGRADATGYTLPMTQEQLADSLGLTPVHVNRTLKALEAEGLIERHRRHISFPSFGELSKMADFNPRYLHLKG